MGSGSTRKSIAPKALRKQQQSTQPISTLPPISRHGVGRWWGEPEWSGITLYPTRAKTSDTANRGSESPSRNRLRRPVPKAPKNCRNRPSRSRPDPQSPGTGWAGGGVSQNGAESTSIQHFQKPPTPQTEAPNHRVAIVYPDQHPKSPKTAEIDPADLHSGSPHHRPTPCPLHPPL